MTSVVGIHSEEIATCVFALVAVFSRDLSTLIRLQDRENQVKEKVRIVSPVNRTLGVIGLERIRAEGARSGVDHPR